jgi:hypothetical protein
MPEPYTLAAYVVSTASIVTAGAATFAAKYVRDAKANSEKALRLLQGEEGVDDGGLVHDVEANRRALLHADLYPPRASDGGEHGD